MSPAESLFRARIETDAREEADRLIGQWKALREEANGVVSVLRALDLPVPTDLSALLGEAPVSDTPAPVATPPKVAVPPPPKPSEPVAQTPAPPVAAPVAAPPVAEPAPTPAAPTPGEGSGRGRNLATLGDPITTAPEKLRAMPVLADKEFVRKPWLETAEGQYTVLEVINGRNTSVASEISRVTGQPPARVSDYLRALEGAGLITRTGRNRHDEVKAKQPGHPGRAAVEYRPSQTGLTLTGSVAPAIATPTPAAATPPKPVVSSDKEAATAAREKLAAEILPSVRDYVTTRDGTGPFSPNQVQDAIGGNPPAPLGTIKTALRALQDRKVVRNVSPTADLLLYEYRKPTSAGAAAELDAKAAKAAAPAPSGNGPVAGTGKGMTVTDPDVRQLIKAIEAAGGTVTKGASGHFKVSNGTRSVDISSTPSSKRSVMNDRARVRRILPTLAA